MTALPSCTSTPSPASDDVLLSALRRGEPRARAEMVRRYEPALLRATRRILREDASARDAVQDTWVVALTRLDSFEGRSSLKSWLTGIALNHARAARDDARRTVPAGVPGTPHERGVAGEPRDVLDRATDRTPEGVLIDDERRKALDDAMATLSSGQRSVLALELRERSPAESRAALAISDVARRVRLCRARARLRERLAPLAA